MAGLRIAGLVLCAWIAGALGCGAVLAQEAPSQQERLVAEVEAHERFFRYVDLPDLRDLQASLRVLRGQAGACPLECEAPDCAGLVASLAAADQIDMSLMQLVDVLDHLHDLEVRHLASLQGEAVLAEDRFRQDAEILVYQRFLVEVAGHITNTVFVFGDIESALEAGADANVIQLAYDLSELAGDMDSLSRGMLGLTSASSSGFEQEMATLRSELGNVANIAGGKDVRLNALAIIARRMVALGQAEMERRQAEVDALQREAYRERREVDQALTRTHALAVQAALLRTLAAEARQTADALAPCAATCRASAPPAQVLHLFLADPARGGNPDRLDQAAIEDLRTLIATSARVLREGWQPDCEPVADAEETETDLAAVLAPPGPDAELARQVCFGMSRVGAVQAFDGDLQARLATPMTGFMNSCTAWHEQVQAWPQNYANPAHAQAVCQAECTMMGDYDRYILAQSPVAIAHVARLDEADRARQRRALDDELAGLAISLRLARRADSAPQGWEGWPDEAALEAQRVALLDRREALSEASLWAQAQTQYWRQAESPQMMRCLSPEAIAERASQCRAACGTNAAPPLSCVNPAPSWIGRLGEALYPPSHPQRTAFEAQFGASGPVTPGGPLPGGTPLPGPVPLPQAPAMPPVQPLVVDPVPAPQPVPIPVDPED
ncbi:hypothetical protein [Maricaulis parjimensis]|uniref:hypothetical protein n=1 Tax=Maricaulis parjimensis TaxID=144023 RepID=UPI00193A2452|nr:hypothetical protein [Maricaulis parjimensis]